LLARSLLTSHQEDEREVPGPPISLDWKQTSNQECACVAGVRLSLSFQHDGKELWCERTVQRNRDHDGVSEERGKQRSQRLEAAHPTCCGEQVDPPPAVGLG